MAIPSAAISLENETHFLAAQTHITCTDESPFPEVEQPEQEQEQEQQAAAAPPAASQQKSSINWGALAVGVVAAVGLCLVAAPYIAAGVAIAGLTGVGATVATSAASWAIGAMGFTIGYMSTDDLQHGRTADLGEYAKRAAQAGVVGLITGAIFGPLLGATTGFAYVGLSGGSGAFSSLLNDMLFNDGNIDYDNLRLATFLGIAGGMLSKPGRAAAAEGPSNPKMSPRDPDFSEPPIYREGPYSSEQRDAFLKGEPAGTKLAPHHRHQIPVRDGGVIDELPGPGHPEGNQHTAGSPSRHPSKSVFNSEDGGNKLRQDEIEAQWKEKGDRLVEVEPSVWVDTGPK